MPSSGAGRCPVCADLSPSRGEISEARASKQTRLGAAALVAADQRTAGTHTAPSTDRQQPSTFLEQHADQADDLLALEQEHRGAAGFAGSARSAALANAPAPPKAQATPQPPELRTPRACGCRWGRNLAKRLDQLSQARRGDLWFHPRKWPGQPC